jgi:hypothetical protein
MNPQFPPPSPSHSSSRRKLFIVFAVIYGLVLVATAALLLTHHHRPNTASSGVNIPVFSDEHKAGANTKRETDINMLQTQLEAFFSQNGYYPSLTDLNNTNWRSANMNSLDPGGLVDPSSTCNPATTGCLGSSPAAGVYAYVVTDSSGKSCESDDTKCAKYTLTATYEGQVNGATTFTKSNLD